PPPPAAAPPAPAGRSTFAAPSAALPPAPASAPTPARGAELAHPHASNAAGASHARNDGADGRDGTDNRTPPTHISAASRRHRVRKMHGALRRPPVSRSHDHRE